MARAGQAARDGKAGSRAAKARARECRDRVDSTVIVSHRLRRVQLRLRVRLRRRQLQDRRLGMRAAPVRMRLVLLRLDKLDKLEQNSKTEQ